MHVLRDAKAMNESSDLTGRIAKTVREKQSTLFVVHDSRILCHIVTLSVVTFEQKSNQNLLQGDLPAGSWIF